ncbi:CHAD domain-containing protein [Tritonibacter scottomollicae]|uniref:CHAD domain-containing protein n=1 Tax=Tritonibacter scottomollicae TaxID=483013 RepID=A0ABZ0HBY2_TRISK|nr:CHAD domain-containing protein [Tritonibacter scottomollicae]WOI32006.1 CHAD domain-containing protein [Tritonibacter scottomollicae]
MTDPHSPANHPASIMAEVMEEIDTARAFVARDDAFDSAQALRVALRRLRSGLTLFRPLLPPDHNKALLDDARWLSAEVTRLRDLYLLWQDTLTPARVALPDNTALQSLEVRALERINSERAALRELLEGERVVEMMARGRDMSDPEFWRPAAGSQEKLEALCHETLELRLNQALKHGETLKRLDSQARDSFRKSLRKLRATAEFTQVMFSSKKTKAFLKQLKKLLDSMVAARDASAVRDRLEDLMKDMDAASPEHHIANELIKAKEAGVGLDHKRLQKMWRATETLPLY